MTRKRAEFTTLTKLKALARYVRCPGLPEKRHACGQPFGRLEDIQFDHAAAEVFTQDNSPENCRPLCADCHSLKTNGTRATSAGSDKHMAAKGKRLRGELKPKKKAKIANRGFPSREERRAVKEKYAR